VDTDEHSDSDCYGNTNSYTYEDANGNPDCNSDCNRNGDADEHLDGYSHGYEYIDTDSSGW
jgi:hypothetical protein